MKIILIISGLFILSFSLTALIRYIALKRKLISIPNERSLHVIPTPLGGGLAIIITWYSGITIFYFLKLISPDLYFALLSGFLIAIISLIDDMRGLKPFIRLCFQFITAITAFLILGGLRRFVIPGFDFNYNLIVYPLVVVGMVWFINLFNFMDGVDGFVSLEALIICLVIYYLSGDLINLVLIACISGFLYWNWPKARIFMGDVGSTQLGFILVVLGIYFHNTFRFSVLNWIMLSSPFWFDATLTLFRRWRNSEKLSVAHKKHAYQRIVQAGFSHLKVNFWLIIINLFVFIIILIYREIKFLQVPLFVLTLIFFYMLTRYVDKKVPFRKD